MLNLTVVSYFLALVTKVKVLFSVVEETLVPSPELGETNEELDKFLNDDIVVLQLGNDSDTSGADMVQGIALGVLNPAGYEYYLTCKGVALVVPGKNGVLNSTSVMPFSYGSVVRKWLLCDERQLYVLAEASKYLMILANSKDDPEAYAQYPEVEWY